MKPVKLEEISVSIFLVYEKIITVEEYETQLHTLFLENPENDILLNLEWQTDIEQSITYIKESIDFTTLDIVLFGKCFMEKITEFYKEEHTNFKNFAIRMYDLWKSLPESIQHQQPFVSLSYGDDPLSWGDEAQCRNIYENMMNYYNTQ